MHFSRLSGSWVLSLLNPADVLKEMLRFIKKEEGRWRRKKKIKCAHLLLSKDLCLWPQSDGKNLGVLFPILEGMKNLWIFNKKGNLGLSRTIELWIDIVLALFYWFFKLNLNRGKWEILSYSRIPINKSRSNERKLNITLWKHHE